MTGAPDTYGEVDAFWQGVEAGHLPDPQGQGEASSIAVTDGKSPWLGIRCGTCNQTFRPGDQVRLKPDGTVGHLDPALDRSPVDPADDEHSRPDDDQAAPAAQGPAHSDGFAEGLLMAWPPPRDVPVFRLGPADWQVTTPRNGSTAPTCPGCGHTFRIGDMVIICPCAGPDGDPRREYCRIAVHRDPARGLCCWDDWAPDGQLRRCPRTFEQLSW
jgi:hypothetical protein